MGSRWMMVGVVALALGAGACSRDDTGKVGVQLDSAGSKIERGVQKVGKELDTAWTGVKTELSEAQIDGMLGQINGMDSVEVTMTPEGDVTLTGTVATPERKELAGTIVRETHGVRSVTNTIAIGSGPVVPTDSARADTAGKR